MTAFRFGLGVPGGVPVAVGLALLIAAAIVWSLFELRRERSRRRKLWLGALRIATGLAAVLVAVQPTWTGEKIQRAEGRLAVLADASRSMTVASGGTTRAERLAALADRWRDAPGGSAATAFAFGSKVRPASLARIADGIAASDDETRIVAAALDVARNDVAGDLGAIVVVSDGADSSRNASFGELARLGVKVHTVAVGSDESLRDDAIAEVQADAVAFLRQQGKVRVVVRSLGGSREPIPVSLRLGEQLVREVTAEPDAHGEAAVEIPFEPDSLGRSVYTLSIPVAPEDAVPENNERAFLVRVTRDKLRVLLVAGRPSWDERFLRAFLKRDPSIDLISFFILRTAADLTMASPDELALIPFPTDELFSEHLGSFDLVIFQNFEYGPYQMAAYLPRIRDYVRRGGGFAMIGGDLSFGSGGYAETPLAEILPVHIPPSGTPETRALITGRFTPRLAEDLARHPLLELAPTPAANAEAWAGLAPLEGANLILGLAPGARALLVHPTERAQGGAAMPLLAVGTAGRGRTLALATDTSWRWGITTGGRTGDASAYERFYDRVLRWLTKDPSLDPARITTDREHYGPSARVRVTALLRDERYEPLADRTVRIAIVDDAGEELSGEDVRVDGDGEAAVELRGPAHPGGYRVVARLVDASEPLAEEGFVVEAGGDELADPRARPETLEALAEATGGSYFATPEAAPPLADLDATRARSLGTTTFAPLASPWAFLIVLALFGAEWILRRTWGRR